MGCSGSQDVCMYVCMYVTHFEVCLEPYISLNSKRILVKFWILNRMTMPNKPYDTTSEDDQNGRRPKWKTTKMEDDQNGRRPKWKMTKMEDDQNGRRPKWKTTKMEDDQKRRPH